jgi:hypothetical protein
MPSRSLKTTAASLAASAAVSLASFGAGVGAQPTGRVEVGVLTCSVSGGAGFVFGSSKRLDCTFQAGPRREEYAGTINKFGLDIGFTGSGVMTWAVFAPTATFGPGSLAGTYGGAAGEATIGVGLGANVLVGGSTRTFALQPLSVQAQQGLNLAVGIAALELRPQ